MRRVLAQCDGCEIPRPLTRDDRELITISQRGDKANLSLSVPVPFSALSGRVDPLSADLLQIAAFAYGLDQQVTRHFDGDVHGDKWKRDLALCIPVSDPDFWRQTNIQDALMAALGFATDDKWSFHFSGAQPDLPEGFFLDLGVAEAMGKPDQVVLMSGGLDSTCAVVEQHASHGHRPVLVSHSPAFHLVSRQEDVRRELVQTFRDWPFPIVPIGVHRSDGTDPVESTMRSRAFLFASMGTLVAISLGLEDVILADNGVVSLNVPVNRQIVGAHASRSTHPRFLRLFNAFIRTIFADRAPTVSNPLWSRTRAETLDVLRRHGCERIIGATISCSHVQGLAGHAPQCGVCSQCIDRRVGVEAAGLEAFDTRKYETDLFVDELRDGTARTMALSFMRRGNRLADASPEQMIIDYSELIDALPPAGRDQAAVAKELTSMLSRHGQEVVRVMKDQIRQHSDTYLRARLPDHCLILLIGQQDQPIQASLDLEGDERGGHESRDAFMHWLTTLAPGAKAVVQRLQEAQEQGTEPTRWAILKESAASAGSHPTRMEDVFRRNTGWREFIEQAPRGYWRLRRTATNVHKTST